MMCKHLNFVVRGQDLYGTAWCPDCEKRIGLAVCFNNLADVMRQSIKGEWPPDA